jgi:hypothetical protein
LVRDEANGEVEPFEYPTAVLGLGPRNPLVVLGHSKYEENDALTVGQEVGHDGDARSWRMVSAVGVVGPLAPSTASPACMAWATSSVTVPLDPDGALTPGFGDASGLALAVAWLVGVTALAAVQFHRLAKPGHRQAPVDVPDGHLVPAGHDGGTRPAWKAMTTS